MTGFSRESLQVECYAGYRSEQEPRAFTLRGRRFEVVEILDRWQGIDHRYFKLKAGGGAELILRYDLEADVWEIKCHAEPPQQA